MAAATRYSYSCNPTTKRRQPRPTNRQKQLSFSATLAKQLALCCIVALFLTILSRQQGYSSHNDVIERLFANDYSRMLASSSIVTNIGATKTNITLNTNNNTTSKTNNIIDDSFLVHMERGFGADTVWESLLQEGAAILWRNSNTTTTTTRSRLVAMEIGMHRPLQCLQAARAGFEAHCVEPSPASFPYIRTIVGKEPDEIQSRVHLYQKAASSQTGVMLNFTSMGSTGDHVGQVDVWNMKAHPTQQHNNDTTKQDDDNNSIIQVPSVRLDDLIVHGVSLQKEERIFLLKIDTQGYEPAVFAGLSETVFQQARIDYILLEYWPKGIDIMTTGTVANGTCLAANLLQDLLTAGYTLYALPNAAHPRSPKLARKQLHEEVAPLDNVRANCLYYYQLEDRFPSSDYHMGYWSDFLAVAPGAALRSDSSQRREGANVPLPVTQVGQLLLRRGEPTARQAH